MTAPPLSLPVRLAMAAIIMAAVFTAHGNTLTFDYIWEDRNNFIDESPVKDWRNIPRFFVRSAHEGFSVSHVTPYYRPVTVTSWGIDWLIFRGNPAGSHLLNILIHWGASILLFSIALRLTGGFSPSLAAALLFAVHPAGVESVAYVAARADILCTLFMAGSFLAYLRFRDSGRMRQALLSLLLYLLALLSKEPAVMMPLFLLAAQWGEREQTPLRRLLAPPLAAALLVAAYLFLRSHLLSRTSWDQTPLLERFWTSIHVTGKYLLTLLFPADLRTFYDIPTLVSPLQTEVWTGGVVILLWCGVSALLVRAGHRRGGVLLLLVPLSLLPSSNLPAMILPSPVALRYLHFPLAIFSFAAAATLAPLPAVRVLGKPVPLGVLPLFLLIPPATFYTATTSIRWKENDRFFTAMLADAPKSPLAFKLAANHYGKSGRGGEMARLYAVAYTLTRNRQIETAREMIRLGEPRRAREELLKLPNPLGDREVVEILSSLGGR
ncbi:MAG: hypothetical protein Fur0034_19150 [Desulfuromonadia bacterium]